MPKRMVHDTEIRYEAYGTGAPIVYLQSVLGGINPGAYYFAGRLSKNFKVLIWDGPNCGQSGAAIKNTVSEYHLACAYLAGLLEVLGLSSVHLAGCSGGGEMGLLFAHLLPRTGPQSRNVPSHRHLMPNRTGNRPSPLFRSRRRGGKIHVECR